MEVSDAAEEAQKKYFFNHSTVIISSDFVRAKETALIVAQVFGAGDVILSQKLRERFFGEWESSSNDNYQKIWEGDVVGDGHSDNGVENTTDVLARVLSLIDELELKFDGKKILMVSHGDTLQILQTAFEGVSPSMHRSVDNLKTAEIRLIIK